MEEKQRKDGKRAFPSFLCLHSFAHLRTPAPQGGGAASRNKSLNAPPNWASKNREVSPAPSCRARAARVFRHRLLAARDESLRVRIDETDATGGGRPFALLPADARQAGAAKRPA